MGLLRKIIGPMSKYDNDIPYTYEARIKIIDADEYNSFYADTICALVEYLDEQKIEPDDVTLYEIFKGKDNKLDSEYCVSRDGRWLSREQLCATFTQRYPGHIHENYCTFEDREKDVEGP